MKPPEFGNKVEISVLCTVYCKLKFHLITTVKQKRSTEGCSKLEKIKKKDKFRRDWSQEGLNFDISAHASLKVGQDQVSGGDVNRLLFASVLFSRYSRELSFRDIGENYLFANMKRREYVYYMHFIHKRVLRHVSREYKTL